MKTGEASDFLAKAKEAEKLARFFHKHYEKLAPRYGYKTRKKTRVPWSKLPKNNKNLMVATAFRALVDLRNS